jgi:hypothetical protein
VTPVSGGIGLTSFSSSSKISARARTGWSSQRRTRSSSRITCCLVEGSTLGSYVVGPGGLGMLEAISARSFPQVLSSPSIVVWA